MHSPLIKHSSGTKGRRCWKFTVNSEFYGLNHTFHPFIYHHENLQAFYLIGGLKTIRCETFKQACEQLEKMTVEKYFKGLGSDYYPLKKQL